ncbi:MAG: penicillin-binding protein 2 [Planctomycetota bacterium]
MSQPSPAFPFEFFCLRAKCFYLLIFVSFLTLWSRCFYIQIYQHSAFKKLADQRHLVKIPTPGERGKIYSQDGTLYAVSFPALSLCANPKLIQNEKEVAYCLGQLLKKDPVPLYQLFLKKEKSFVWIQRKLTAEEVNQIEQLGIEGLEFRSETNRFYPRGRELSHLLGFADIDNIGKEGIELTFNKDLQGKDGFRWSLRDAGQRAIQLLGGKEVERVNGANIRLTLNSTLQYILEEELNTLYKEYEPKSVSGLLLDPETGAVLAIGGFPNFDPNHYYKFSPPERKNSALVDAYEPGSTFKSFIAASVLEEKLFQINDVIFCENGRWEVEGRRALKDYHPYGDLEFWEVIAKSSNIGCGKMSLKLGPEKFYGWLKKFGFGEPLKMLWPSHSKGSLKALKKWSPTTILSIQMGHEIMTTPLQLARAYSSFANGGYRVEPYCIEEILSPDNGVLYSAKPEKKKILSLETVQKMNYLLTKVFTDGTAKGSRAKGYTFAGKTGTTEKVNPQTKSYYKDRNISSFMAFGPVGRARLIAFVVADDPKSKAGGHMTGGRVAAPAVSRMMERSLHYLEVPMEAEANSFEDFPSFLATYYPSSSTENTLSEASNVVLEESPK